MCAGFCGFGDELLWFVVQLHGAVYYLVQGAGSDVGVVWGLVGVGM